MVSSHNGSEGLYKSRQKSWIMLKYPDIIFVLFLREIGDF